MRRLDTTQATMFSYRTPQHSSRAASVRQPVASFVFHPFRAAVGSAYRCSLLYRWFVGLSMDDAVWAATSSGENRERLFSEAVMREFFGKVLALGKWKKLISHEHFMADGTLTEAWASMKRFVPNRAEGWRRQAAGG